MAKLKWHCEYCNVSNDDWGQEECILHENICSFNPKNKHCNSCYNYNLGDCFESNVCDKNVFDFHIRMIENKFNCTSWSKNSIDE